MVRCHLLSGAIHASIESATKQRLKWGYKMKKFFISELEENKTKAREADIMNVHEESGKCNKS